MTAAHSKPETWRDVYRALRDKIDAGDLAPGDGLPTLSTLAREEGITIHGARRAMAKLRDEGRVISWQGYGHQVAGSRIAYRIDARPWFGENLSRAGRNGASRMIAARTTRLSRELARYMRLSPGTPVYQSELVRIVEDRPVILARNHFPCARFQGILETLDRTLSVTKALAEYGVSPMTRLETRLEARMPTAHEALELNIPGNQPVIVTIGVNADDAGNVVEVSHSVSRADCVAFQV